jgi:phosphoserine phosphatase
MTTRIILVRHGQSTYNALGLYQGSSDVSRLTTCGYRQAKQTGEWLKNQPIHTIYTSPLQRVLKTAHTLLDSLPIARRSLQTSQDLIEVDLPRWQGLPFQHVRECFPEEYLAWKQRPHEFSMEISDLTAIRRGNLVTLPKIERVYPALQLYGRAYRFWQKILPRHSGQTVLIVSHGGTNRALIHTALGISPEFYHRIQQSNCGVNVVEFADNSPDSGYLLASNLTACTGENLVSIAEKDGLRLLLIPACSESNPENLDRLLAGVNIDFCIAESSADCQRIASPLLRSRPRTIDLQVSDDDFPRIWHQSIERSFGQCRSSLTGVVIAQASAIQKQIGQVSGLPSDRYSRLRLLPNSITSLHYFHTDHPPVLQTLNFSPVLPL